MNIKILGTGCEKCKKLTALCSEIISENKMDAQLTKVTDINEIMNFGVMVTPALVIDDIVKFAGRIPSKDELKKIIFGTK